MASLTIRNLDDELKQLLRMQAAGNRRSMEEEARQILRSAVKVASETTRESLASRINRRFHGLDADAINLPLRHPVRTPPDMNEQ
jgi:plasmid stability protein